MPQNEADFEQALASYADPGHAGHPRVLAVRVMAAVEMLPRKRHWLFHPVVIALETAFLLMIAAVIVPWQPERAPRKAFGPSFTPSQVSVLPSSSSPISVQPAPARFRQARTAARSEARKPPKLDQFPASTPLTDQEKLLAAFLNETPAAQQQAVAKTKSESDKPLTISELRIEPIKPEIQP